MPEDTQSKAEPLSVAEFLGSLSRSGLLTQLQLDVLRAETGGSAGDAAAMAEQLVAEGVLTEFQARRLLVGNERGLVINRYCVLDMIGNGSMGLVFKARHVLMGRLVAIKIISSRSSAGADAMPRFLREMQIVGLMDHPNVVRAFDADQIDGRPYIVMEYIPGENLAQAMQRKGPLTPEEAAGYMAQAARGLSHAHEKGIIHRDVKPSNLALDPTGVVKVLDLGLGAFVAVADGETTEQDLDRGVAVGTADFMSPEQISGQPLDGRTDLFSLGCAMYQLLTGSHAFPGPAKLDRLMSRLQRDHVPIRDVRPNLPYPVVAVLDRLLERQPSNRFASAEEAAEALEELASSPRTARPFSVTSGRKGRPSPPPTAGANEPDAALLNWSVIDTALRSEEKRSPSRPDAERMRPASDPPAAVNLAAYRKGLETDDGESGSEAHRRYRTELIELNRATTKAAERESEEGSSSPVGRWLESLGERIGNSLAEPGAEVVVVLTALIVLALALALAYALA